MSMACPCGTGREFSECCQPLLTGTAKAVTAEQLMRARYSAFASGNVDFILASMMPAMRAEQDVDALRAWSANAKWLGLEVARTERGGADDNQGVVEFVASYELDGQPREHRERARFRRRNGLWMYEDGREITNQQPVRRESRVGRNDPCTCGSGKKYKNCCAA
ncbi:MAG: YchJ family protein [Gammaproteobacteria bacterium]|nr:YchJ family protein [Gammaproteobacteria bacterium]